MENKKKQRKIHLLSTIRTGSPGFAENSSAFSEKHGILFLGDKSGYLHFVLLRKTLNIKRIYFPQGISSLKYSENNRTLLFLTGISIGSWKFKGNSLMQKQLNFIPLIIDIIRDENLIAVAGRSHGIHFYNFNFQNTFTTYYKDYDTSFIGLHYFPSNKCLLACIEQGGIVAFDHKTQRIIQHEFSDKTPTRYLWCVEDGSILVSASAGKLYLRKFSLNQGFETKIFTWMKQNDLIGVIPLRDGYIFALHGMDQEICIVRVKDWQIAKTMRFFKNTTGGISSSILGKLRNFIVNEKAEGLTYLFKYQYTSLPNYFLLLFIIQQQLFIRQKII